jgi:hypothetical protein
VNPLSGALLYGRLLASPANIKLGWKGLQGTNALAYSVNYRQKKFYNIGPWIHCYKTLFVIKGHYNNSYYDFTYNGFAYNDNTSSPAVELASFFIYLLLL